MPNARRKWKDRCIYRIVAIFGWWCRRLPKGWAMQLGRAIGLLYYYLIKKRREIASNNLQIAFGNHFTAAQRTEICKASFINVGKTCIEFLRFPKRNAENIWNEVTVGTAEKISTPL